MDGTAGETLASNIIESLKSLDVDLTKLGGQCYDGAVNMSGITKGVASIITA